MERPPGFIQGERLVETTDLTKLYGDLPAVQDLTFALGPGEILGLVGPNGAGKTTTLRCLSGVIPPTRGRVKLAGFDLATEPIRAKAQLAFIPDEPQLFDYLTVEEHLVFTARLYGAPGALDRTDTLLEELELDGKRRTLANALSRGMKQKLAIACGLLHDPRVILLDEPLTGLDPMGIRRMKATIAARAQRGAAVILSSHLLPLVEELCSKVLIIQHGRIVALGSMAEIASERPELAGRGLEDLFLALTDSPHSER
jgi:ABC-2 type transport system ATP-binding protein